jgi:hypothetical protein
MIKRLLIIILMAFMPIAIYGQVPPEEFFKGLDLLTINKQEAKKQFLIAHKKDSIFHGTYHFLGVIYIAENQPDSAIFCFKKSIELNKENTNHTKEMAYVRLIDTYLYQFDFKSSFSVAWEAYLMYSENKGFVQELQDVCLWSYYTRHNGLDSTYLSPEIRKEYIVNSIPEEYLILRRIRINDNPLQFNGQRLVKIKRENFDILSCSYSNNAEKIDLKFKLNWDMNKYYGGKDGDTKGVYADSNNPIFERIGALLVSDSKINLKEEITKIKIE